MEDNRKCVAVDIDLQFCLVDLCRKVNNVDFEYIVYMSRLKAGARPLEVSHNLSLSANPAEVITDIILHDDTAFCLVLANDQLAESTIQQFTRKPVFDGCQRVNGLNSKSHKILVQLKPELFGAAGKITASTGSEEPTSDSKIE